MNPDLARLHDYPFQRLAALTRDVPAPDKAPIALSVGEPRHEPPPFLEAAAREGLAASARYPTLRGTPTLRRAIAEWANRRYRLARQPLDPDTQVLPCNGSREALFAIAQTVVDRGRDPVVMMPNPFYQIYEGAALLAGAQPYYLNTEPDDYRLPLETVPERVWRRTQLVYLCSPGNPTGAVLDRRTYGELIERAGHYGFTIASDECYSELYFEEDSPPPGLLQVAAEMGVAAFRHCLVFQSLSKRSNLPGLRSGFVAGDPELIGQFHRYRTYHGCAMPFVSQAVSTAAWQDEGHVAANRACYRVKFAAVLETLAPVLDVRAPQAGFYLWPRTPVDDETFTRELLARENVRVLPGRYLSRPLDGRDPGAGRVRMALVAPLAECREAAERIRRFVAQL